MVINSEICFKFYGNRLRTALNSSRFAVNSQSIRPKNQSIVLAIDKQPKVVWLLTSLATQNEGLDFGLIG